MPEGSSKLMACFSGSARYGGAFTGEFRADEDDRYKVTKGLLDRFGEKRVIDSPITESGFAGLCVGAALAGLHPIVRHLRWETFGRRRLTGSSASS